MKTFHCDHCQQTIFFEISRCVNCQRDLAYLPDVADMAALEKAADNQWRSLAPVSQGRLYRLCGNYQGGNVCNWAIPADSPETLCQCCRLTRVIPDLSRPGRVESWYRLEVAKRRLIYSLMVLKLPLASKTDDPQHGLAFEFLADPEPGDGAPAGAVLTGHADGVITVNLAEADDVERERRRRDLHEPYRTLPEAPQAAFETLINSWFSLTYVLNNLNRSMGLADAYPFVLATPVIEKLRFIHERIAAADRAPATGAPAPAAISLVNEPALSR